MNRLEIKEKAKVLAKEHLKSFWGGLLIIVAITIVCTLAIDLLINENSILYSVLTLVLSCFTMTLQIGFYSYLLKIIRQEEGNREDIFKYVGAVIPLITITLLVMIFTFLWSLLFIVPGIIAALGYSMVYLLYIDQPDQLPMEYLNKSNEMMKGYKWDYFKFSLSFLGWIVFSIITFGIGLIWTIPYVSFAETIYYVELKKKKEEFTLERK